MIGGEGGATIYFGSKFHAICDRGHHQDSPALYGIAKACLVVEICCFAGRENSHFLKLSKFSNAISGESQELQNLGSRSIFRAKNHMRTGK